MTPKLNKELRHPGIVSCLLAFLLCFSASGQTPLTADGLASFGTNAPAGGGGGGCTPSYAPPFGTGNRTNSITVYHVGLGVGGSPSIFVDGSTTGTGYFWGGDVLDGSQAVQFVFSTAVVIKGFRIYQSGADAQGTWKFQGSNTATPNVALTPGDWTDLGTSFSLGGATLVTISGQNTTSSSYTMYQLNGLSGSASAGPWQYEIEFETCP